MTRFSVITVVRNDRAGVVRTLKSVFAQSWPDYEIVVQDGASTDGTSDLLRSFGTWIDALESAPDGGIYDAMNRATARATGDWLLFLNAGDVFEAPGVLAEVAAQLEEDDEIVVGEAIEAETGKVHPHPAPELFWSGTVQDHQASFIRRDVMQDFGYDTRFRIAADLDFFSRVRLAGRRIRRIPTHVARKPYAQGASADFLERFRERLPLLEGHFGTEYPVAETLHGQLKAYAARTFGLEAQTLDGLSTEALLDTCERWNRALNCERYQAGSAPA